MAGHPSAGRRFFPHWFWPNLLAALVFVVSLAVTYGLWLNARENSLHELATNFNYRSREIAQRLAQRMATYEQVLRGAQGFLFVNSDVSREDFRAYVNTLRLEEHFPGIQGIGISLLIPKNRLREHVQAMRAQGFPGYAIVPPGERDPYTAIVQIEPFSGPNLRAFGFDMYSQPIRRAAMERARDTGAAALSGKVVLVQEEGRNVQSGVLMYLPVYRRDMPRDTQDARRAALTGWAYAPFRMNDLMEGLGGERSSDLRVQIFDGDTMSEQSELYDSGTVAGQPAVEESLFRAPLPIDTAGRPWIVYIRSGAGFEAQLDRDRPRLVAAGGVIVGFLLSLLVWLLATGRRRALTLATAMTEQLRSSEFRLKNALEGAGHGVWDWNNQTGQVTYSDQWKKMLGYADHEIGNTMREWERLVHPEDRQQALLGVDDYISGRKDVYVVEHRMRTGDGNWKWILSRGVVAQRDANGKALRTIGTHTDIDRIKRSEQELRESNARLAAERRHMQVVLENSHDAFVAIDANELITDWNVQAERTFGWNAQEAIGRRISDLIIPVDQREAHRNGFARFRRTGTGRIVHQRIEVNAVHKSGRLIPVELAVAAVRQGQMYTANAFIRDISERKEAQRLEAERLRSLEEARLALQHSQKLEAVGKLTGGVAHDFNNVLQIVAGNLQLLQLLLTGNDKAEKRLASALEAVERGAKLSSQLLAFARRQPLRPVVVNLGSMLRNLNDLLRQALGATITLRTEVADGLWNTLVDPNQMENVVLNLVINARDALGGKGDVLIELSNVLLDQDTVMSHPDLAAGEYVQFAISDNGSGMAPEVAEQAFEPFFTTKPAGEGTGLGLSMAYGFVKQSGGHIQIYSELGHGTTVKIYLPRCTDSETRRDQRSERSDGVLAGGGETILVVEDDPGVRTTVVSVLSELGYHVLQSSSGEAAIEAIKGGASIDLLFTDVVMPGHISGPELARAARLLVPGLPVLFTSGYTRNVMGQAGRLPPEVSLLSKPYRREELARRIRQLLLNPSEERAAGTGPSHSPSPSPSPTGG